MSLSALHVNDSCDAFATYTTGMSFLLSNYLRVRGEIAYSITANVFPSICSASDENRNRTTLLAQPLRRLLNLRPLSGQNDLWRIWIIFQSQAGAHDATGNVRQIFDRATAQFTSDVFARI